jgi:hypothetical protein
MLGKYFSNYKINNSKTAHDLESEYQLLIGCDLAMVSTFDLS